MANKSRQVTVRETAASGALSTATPEGSHRPLTTQEVIGRSLVNPQIAETLDCKASSNLARYTLGISPVSMAKNYHDWLGHLVIVPGKQARLAEKAVRKAVRLGLYAAQSMVDPNTPPCIEPLPQDRRFAHEG